MAFSQNIAYDPFAIGQNRAVYGSLEEESHTMQSPDSARSSVVSDEDEAPDQIIKDATNKTFSRNDLDFLYNTSDREDTSYKDWPPMFMTTKVLWDQYMEDELEVMFSNLKMKLQIDQPEENPDDDGDGARSVHTANSSVMSPGARTVSTAGDATVASSVDHSLDPRRSIAANATSLVDETTDTVVALRSMQLTRDRITGTEVGAPPEEDEEKPEAALHKPHVVEIDPLPFGLMCHGRVPWGETRYFQVEVTDPTAILTVTLMVTTPTADAVAAYTEERGDGDGDDRAATAGGDSGPSAAQPPQPPRSAGGIGSARPGPALLLPAPGTDENGEVKPSAEVSAVEQAAAVAAAAATGDGRAVWSTEEVSRRRPAGLAKADLMVAKATVPTLLDYHWKSASPGPRDRIVVYPKEPRGGAGTYIVAVHAPPFQQLVDRVCETRGTVHRAPKPKVVLSPRSRRRAAQEKEEAANAAKAAGLPVPVDKQEGLLFGGGAAPSDGPSFAICCNQSGSELNSSAAMKRVEPVISRLSRLGDQRVGELLGDFTGTAKRVDAQILAEQPKEATVEGDEEARAEAAAQLAEHTAAAAKAETERQRIELAAAKAAADAEELEEDEYDPTAAAERRAQIYDATKRKLEQQALEERERAEKDPWNIPRSAVKEIPMNEMVAFDELLAKIGMRAMKSQEFLDDPLNAEYLLEKFNNPREPSLMGGSMRDPDFERMPEYRPKDFPAMEHGEGQPMPSKWLAQDSAEYGGNYDGEFGVSTKVSTKVDVTAFGVPVMVNATPEELEGYDGEMRIWRPFVRLPSNKRVPAAAAGGGDGGVVGGGEEASQAQSEATSIAERKQAKREAAKRNRKLYPPSPKPAIYSLDQVELSKNRSKLARSPAPKR